MKKQYIHPAILVVTISQATHILAGSYTGLRVSAGNADATEEVLSRGDYGFWDEDE